MRLTIIIIILSLNKLLSQMPESFPADKRIEYANSYIQIKDSIEVYRGISNLSGLTNIDLNRNNFGEYMEWLFTIPDSCAVEPSKYNDKAVIFLLVYTGKPYMSRFSSYNPNILFAIQEVQKLYNTDIDYLYEKPDTAIVDSAYFFDDKINSNSIEDLTHDYYYGFDKSPYRSIIHTFWSKGVKTDSWNTDMYFEFKEKWIKQEKSN